jgi:hypothetical protein
MLPGLSMPVGDCAGLHPDEAATASLHTLSARYRRRGRTARLRLFVHNPTVTNSSLVANILGLPWVEDNEAI